MRLAQSLALPFNFCARLIALSALSLTLAYGQSGASSDLLSPELRAWSDARGGVFRVGVESTFRPYVFPKMETSKVWGEII